MGNAVLSEYEIFMYLLLDLPKLFYPDVKIKENVIGSSKQDWRWPLKMVMPWSLRTVVTKTLILPLTKNLRWIENRVIIITFYSFSFIWIRLTLVKTILERCWARDSWINLSLSDVSDTTLTVFSSLPSTSAKFSSYSVVYVVNWRYEFNSLKSIVSHVHKTVHVHSIVNIVNTKQIIYC